MSASPSATFVHKTLPNYKSEKWLQKYGWERGRGLGKDQQGRLDFVKVSKKDNTTGLGKPSYEVKDFHWWDSVYTKAAQSVKIGESDSSVELVAEKQVEKGKTVYSGMFVTGGTIEDERKEASRKSLVKSEEDLFRVCGHRELRKFKQDGKKARLEQHDSEMQSRIDEHNRKRIDSIYKDVTDAERKMLEKAERKKEKKEKDKKREANKKSAERKKKRKREDVASLSSNESSEEEKVEEKPKKKKKKTKASEE